MFKLKDYIFITVIGFTLVGCSTETELTTTDADGPSVEAEVMGIDISSSGTRAVGMQLKSFGIIVLNQRGKSVTDNYIYLDEAQNTWKKRDGFSMPTSGTMKAFGVSPNMNVLTSKEITKDLQTFEYIVPPTNQTMIKIGSDLGVTYAKTSGRLVLTFTNALATLSVVAQNKLRLQPQGSEQKLPVKLYVESVTLHNVKNHGTFKFHATKNTTGSWTIVGDEYMNYTQVLKNLDGSQKRVLVDSIQWTSILDSLFVLMPQTPSGWTPKGTADADPATDAISVAEAAHKTYFEVKCAMTCNIGGIEQYVWGTETTAKSVYMPYTRGAATVKWAAINTSGLYSLPFSEATVLDDQGHPIKPETNGGNDSFLDAEFVSFSTDDENGNDWVDDWGNPEEVSIEF